MLPSLLRNSCLLHGKEEGDTASLGVSLGMTRWKMQRQHLSFKLMPRGWKSSSLYGHAIVFNGVKSLVFEWFFYMGNEYFFYSTSLISCDAVGGVEVGLMW